MVLRVSRVFNGIQGIRGFRGIRGTRTILVKGQLQLGTLVSRPGGIRLRELRLYQVLKCFGETGKLMIGKVAGFAFT